jgi:hypothetical protein
MAELPRITSVEGRTRASAQMADLHDRGVLAPAYRADIHRRPRQPGAPASPDPSRSARGGQPAAPPGGRRLHDFVTGTEDICQRRVRFHSAAWYAAHNPNSKGGNASEQRDWRPRQGGEMR